MRIIWLVIGLVFFSPQFLSGQESRVSKIDAYLESYKSRIPIPGFSIVIVENDEVVFKKGYGFEQIGSSKPMSVNSPVGIGSIGRGFTAIGILQLVEQGLLALDEPVVKYLPWFETANQDFGKKITVRMCLDNTSGLPAIRNFTPDLEPSRTLEKFVKSMDASHVKRLPGTSHEFSEEGYSIAGLLISEVSGMSYNEYIEQNIFGKLKMNRSSVNPSSNSAFPMTYGHELGLKECLPASKDVIDHHFIPAGSEMQTTASDLGNYMIALLNGGIYQGQRILSAERIEQLFSAQTSFRGLGTMLGGNGLDIEYALGWMGMTIEDRPILIHTGNTGTMASIIGLNREKNQGVAVLFNGDVNRLNRFVYPTLENTANNVIHILNEEDTTDFAVVRFDDPFDEIHDLPENRFDAYVGSYASFGQTSPFFKDMEIKIERNESDELELSVTKSGNPKGRFILQFANESRAVLRSIAHPREIQFKLFPNGTIGGLFMFGSEFLKKESEGKRRFKDIRNDAAEVSFLFPKEINGTWEGNTFSAKWQNQDDPDFSMRISALKKESFESFVEENVDGEWINKGVLKNENVRDCIWTEQSISTLVDDDQLQYYIARYQDPVSNQQAEIIITVPWGSFSSDHQELILNLQRSISFP